MSLYLVRHGRTAWNVAGKAQGWADEPLDDLGRAQANTLPGALDGLRIERILTSPLGRARTTAAPLAEVRSLGIETVPELRERGFGEWEGRHFTEVGDLLRAGGPDIDLVRPPSGESFADVWNRLVPFAESVDDRPTVIVTHGGTLSCLVPMLIGGDLRIRHAFTFANVGITELRRHSDGRWRIARLNDVRHLEGLA